MVYMTADAYVDHAPLHAFDSLTQQHMTSVLQTVAAMGGAWQVDQHKDYQGHLTIIVTPNNSDDLPTFVVSGRVRHIELAAICGDDDLCECGYFSTIEEATAALVAAMSTSSSPTGLTWNNQRIEQNLRSSK